MTSDVIGNAKILATNNTT